MSEEVQIVLRNFLLQRYDNFKRRLTRVLGSEELAGDALQDTWLRLERTEGLGAVQSPSAYLMRMAVNIAVDAQRSQSRMLSAEEVEALIEMPDPAPGPAQTAEDRSEMEALFKAMQRLPARRREILILVRWEGLAHREVAERLGVSLRTVEHELKRGHDFCVARLQDRNERK
jgi:RNA polymerase sigma factor (sigma-70 family)